MCEIAMSETSADPTTIVEAFLKAFAAMDFDTALASIADDCEYTSTAAKIHDPAAA